MILEKMLNAAAPTVAPVFSDAEDVPTWAASSLSSLNAMGVMTATDGEIAPLDPMTRGDTAVSLCALMQTRENT